MDTEKALQLICENEELRFLIEQEEAWIREQQVLEEPLPEDAEPFVIPQVVDANVTKMMQAEARANFMAFARSHPEFYSSAENLAILTDWMLQHRLAPSVRNFELAYARLTDQLDIDETHQTLLDIKRMSSKTFKERLKDESFRKRAEQALEAEHQQEVAEKERKLAESGFKRKHDRDSND